MSARTLRGRGEFLPVRRFGALVEAAEDHALGDGVFAQEAATVSTAISAAASIG
jgi:hypothetical protein